MTLKKSQNSMIELKSLFGSCLEFSKTNEMVSLKLSTNSDRKFQIHTKHLSGDEVLGIGKAILEAYNKLETNEKIIFLKDLPKSLNRPTVDSTEFVRTVLELKSSALHKILLLSSGEHLQFTNKYLHNENFNHILILLAKTKNDEFASSQKLGIGLRDYYIIPGVSPKTANSGVGSMLSSILKTGVFENKIRLLTFLTEKKESFTLEEHMSLDLQQAITTKKHFTKIYEQYWSSIASSRYKELAMSMSAKQLLALGVISESSAVSYIIPESVLRNRAVAMEENDLRTDGERLPISKFLSKQELKRIPASSEFKIDEILESLDCDAATHLAVSVSLAEVLVERGPAVGIKVAFELHKLKSHQFWPDPFNVRNAIVEMILLALQPESDEYPFSWFVQFSDYGWLLSEDYEVSELVSRV